VANGIQLKMQAEKMNGEDCGVRALTRFARCRTQSFVKAVYRAGENRYRRQFIEDDVRLVG
jgi:hypothetical protein